MRTLKVAGRVDIKVLLLEAASIRPSPEWAAPTALRTDVTRVHDREDGSTSSSWASPSRTRGTGPYRPETHRKIMSPPRNTEGHAMPHMWCSSSLVPAGSRRTIITGALLLAVSGLAWIAEAKAEDLVPVWVFVDEETPVAGAQVEVIAEGRPLAQVDGSTMETTNEEGVVGLEFDGLPAAFTVRASGGTADGRPIRGVLRTEVGDHQAADIVYVDPATTLAAELRQLHPEMSERAATHRTKRILGIPNWLDITSDLQRSDRWFGGDAFLLQARRRGGVGRLIHQIAMHPRGPRRYRDGEDQTVVPQLAVPQFVVSGALGLLKQLAPIAGKQLLAKIIGATGLPKDLLDSSDIKEIRRRFDAIDQQQLDIKQSLSTLQQNIERANYDTLVQSAANDVAAIDTAYRKLAWLLRMSADDPTRKNYGAQLRDFIRTDLTPVPDRLRLKLGGSAALGDNVLTAASRLVRSRSRFFGPSESAQVAAIYAYYADAQSRAGVALQALYEADPQTYSPDTPQNEIGRITAAVENQARDYLKPSVPDSVFVDTRTNLMWTRTLVSRVNGLNFKQIMWSGPFTDFTLPTLADIGELTLSDKNPDRRPENPAAWLHRNAKTSSGLGGRATASDSLAETRCDPAFLCKQGYGVRCWAATGRQVNCW